MSRQAARKLAEVPPLLEYIPRLSPDMRPPYHLAEYCEILERAALGEPLRVLCTYPIRHWKTETTLHGIIRALEMNPTWRVVIMAHDWERVKWLGKRTRSLAERTSREGYPGVDVSPTRGWNEIHYWQNAQGGGVLIMSPEQSREGFDCNMLICDDPIAEHKAKDKKERDAVDEAIRYYTSRCQRAGQDGPVIVTMSRHDVDDPIGRRQLRTAVKWLELGSPAIIHLDNRCNHNPICIDRTERAFAEDVWSLEGIKKKRAEEAEADPTERFFWSRLQGEPFVPGGDQFGDPSRYEAEMFPTWPGFRDFIGLDMGFSEAMRADFSAIVVMRAYQTQGFIRYAERFKCDPDVMVDRLLAAQATYGASSIFSYISGPEVGVLKHLRRRGVRVIPMPARYNKLVRAQRTRNAWNAGNILLPNVGPPWVESLIKTAKAFRGGPKDEDDLIDALVSACDGGMFRIADGPKSLGKPRV